MVSLVRADSTLLKDALARIQAEVDECFDTLLPIPTEAHAILVEAMRYAAIAGGKRVRPLLLTATSDMFGVDRSCAIRAACAVESIHAYSLIHDDLPCMDDDDLRHGKPTLHKAFDEATAVLAGDSLHALAFEILSDPKTNGDPFVRTELTACLASASGHDGMAGGQMMDMLADESEFTLHDITRLQQMKTGALLAASVEMGAILGKVGDEGRNHLHLYARDVGLAFQIADDLLDHHGDEAKAGKALRKDEGQGKATFVSILGAEPAERQASALVEQAIGHLNGYGEEADLLRAIARYIVERDH